MEGHGRESWNDRLDLSRTLGWFTTIYPVTFLLDRENDAVQHLRRVKQTIRSVPHKGVSYGVLCTPGETYEPKVTDAVKISFNYLGRFQGVEGRDNFFKLGPSTGMYDISPLQEADHDLLLTCVHQDGKLVLNGSCAGSVVDENLVRMLLSLWEETMSQLILDLDSDSCLGGFTLSDFSLLPKMDSIELIEEAIRAELQIPILSVEDIYPTTPVQTGVLSAMIGERSEYVIQQVWALEGAIDVNRLIASWGKVVETYPILRTCFVSVSTGMYQVVLQENLTPWSEIYEWDPEEEANMLRDHMTAERERGFLMSDTSFNRFTIAKIKGTIF